jgi:hypothetical protein
VKLTSTPSCSTKAYPYRNIHPYLKRLIEAFGPRRCFWGTDLSAMLSRTNCTYHANSSGTLPGGRIGCAVSLAEGAQLKISLLLSKSIENLEYRPSCRY